MAKRRLHYKQPAKAIVPVHTGMSDGAKLAIGAVVVGAIGLGVFMMSKSAAAATTPTTPANPGGNVTPTLPPAGTVFAMTNGHQISLGVTSSTMTAAQIQAALQNLGFSFTGGVPIGPSPGTTPGNFDGAAFWTGATGNIPAAQSGFTINSADDTTAGL